MIGLELSIDPIDHQPRVLTALGYGEDSPPRDDILSRLAEILPRIPKSLKACFRTADITGRERGLVQTDRGTIESPVFGKLAQSADKAVFALVTAGPALDAFMDRSEDTMEALILDAVGGVLVEQGVEAVRQTLADHLKRHVSLPFSPGYCDFPLPAQQTIFHALGAHPLGVRVHPGSFLMTPTKTISFVCAAGDAPLQDNPCAYCQLTTCRMKRV